MLPRIGILGLNGRMGQLLATAAQARSAACVLAAGLVRHPAGQPQADYLITSDPEAVIAHSDVIIDFTQPEAFTRHLALTAKGGKAFLSGTTGLQDSDHAAMAQTARTIPVLYATNTSLSLTVVKILTRMAAQLLRGHDYDISILDQHHRLKKDAPSGTAKTLGEAVVAGNGGVKMPGYAAIRAGHIVGEHEVLFAGDNECIRLQHSVTDRRVFAEGALTAALWLHGKAPGLYGMEDVLGLPRGV